MKIRLFLMLACVGAVAAAPKTKITGAKLFDVNTGKLSKPMEGKWLPNRVYEVSVRGKNEWFFALTDERGQFAEPLELFRSDSVLFGVYLGANVPKQKYRLANDGTWVPSFLEEQYFFWVLSEPPRIKVVGFGSPSEGKP